MSTAEVFLTPEDIEEYIQDALSNDYLHTFGDEDAEIGLCPYITFYVYHKKGDFLHISEQMIDIYREFEQLIDEPFHLIWKDKTQDWFKAGDKRLTTDLLARAKECDDDEFRPFWLGATDQESAIATPRWGCMAKVTDNVEMRYTTLKLTFRHHWYNKHRERWHNFVSSCLKRLQPDQCYSGFEIGNGGFSVLGNYECEALERVCADHFYGMDIDHTSDMGFHYFDDKDGWVNPTDLSGGLRTPVWSFLLSPNWLKRLGKNEAEVRAALNDPRIVIQSIPYAVSQLNPEGQDALWIRLGELDLYPVENGVPELPVLANRLIRPIRCDELKLLSLDAWDDDPNQRFGYEDSIRWMRRFDEDSDWPSAEKRKGAQPSTAKVIPMGRLRADPNDLVTKTGWWHSQAKPNGQALHYFEAGQRFPEWHTTQYGSVIWGFDPNEQKEPPKK